MERLRKAQNRGLLKEIKGYDTIRTTMINAEVVKNNNENNLAILRRFTKRVQGAGVLPRVRSLRYATRKLSPYVKQKKTLKAIAKREHIQEQIKLGKIVDTSRGRK